MADYLVYWKFFWKNVTNVADIGGDWASTSKSLYSQVQKGDRLWVVVSAGTSAPAEWRLLQRLVVERRRQKATEWGDYYMAGRPGSGAIYKLDPQPDFAAILRLLSFAGGRRIRVKGGKIGNALQTHGYRKLSERDAEVLLAYSATLPKTKAA